MAYIHTCMHTLLVVVFFLFCFVLYSFVCLSYFIDEIYYFLCLLLFLVYTCFTNSNIFVLLLIMVQLFPHFFVSLIFKVFFFSCLSHIVSMV